MICIWFQFVFIVIIMLNSVWILSWMVVGVDYVFYVILGCDMQCRIDSNDFWWRSLWNHQCVWKWCTIHYWLMIQWSVSLLSMKNTFLCFLCDRSHIVFVQSIEGRELILLFIQPRNSHTTSLQISWVLFEFQITDMVWFVCFLSLSNESTYLMNG